MSRNETSLSCEQYLERLTKSDRTSQSLHVKLFHKVWAAAEGSQRLRVELTPNPKPDVYQCRVYIDGVQALQLSAKEFHASTVKLPGKVPSSGREQSLRDSASLELLHGFRLEKRGKQLQEWLESPSGDVDRLVEWLVQYGERHPPQSSLAAA